MPAACAAQRLSVDLTHGTDGSLLPLFHNTFGGTGMLAKLRRFLASTRDYRARFGWVSGLRMGWHARSDYATSPLTRFTMLVPEWRRTITLRAGTTDLAVFRQVVVHRGMEFDVDDEPAVIIDAGAHIGLSTLALAHRFPHARIISLEPDAANFEMLCLNTAGLPHVTPLNRALWSEAARVVLRNPGAPPCSLQFGAAGARARGAVAASGVAELLAEFHLPHVDLLKIDIEGAEVDVFSAHDTSWLLRVSTLVIELHDRLRPGCDAAVIKALDGSWSRAQHGEYDVFHRVGVPHPV